MPISPAKIIKISVADLLRMDIFAALLKDLIGEMDILPTPESPTEGD
jgi:hypothetical protein